MRRAATALVAMAGIAAVMSCRDPTEIELDVRTNVPWRDGIDTAFTVGAPGGTEGAFSTTETREPWGADGFVGSLTVVPGSSKDATLSVKIVMGVARDPHDCSIAQPQGCIFARRTLSYVPHRALQLPIELYAQCVGVPCDASTTCNFLGRCVSSAVDPSSCDTPQGCAPPDDKPLPDGGIPPMPPPADAGDASLDSPIGIDASGDAGQDAAGQDAGAGGDVACGMMTCTGGSACCWSIMTFTGSCIGKGGPCPTQNFIVNCDGPEDCGANEKCCASSSTTSCTTGTCVDVICHAGSNTCGAPSTCMADTYAGAYGQCTAGP